MTDRIRRIAIFVDEPEKGVFNWTLIENEDDASAWTDIDHSDRVYSSWSAAYNSGTVALHTLVFDQRVGPRTIGEDEDAAPVG